MRLSPFLSILCRPVFLLRFPAPPLPRRSSALNTAVPAPRHARTKALFAALEQTPTPARTRPDSPSLYARLIFSFFCKTFRRGHGSCLLPEAQVSERSLLLFSEAHYLNGRRPAQLVFRQAISQTPLRTHYLINRPLAYLKETQPTSRHMILCSPSLCESLSVCTSLHATRRHRALAQWSFLVREIGPVLHRL